MDLDTAKENILPLKSGRRADLIESALGNEKEMLELEKQRFEEEIAHYDGKDPLDPWYKYICWIEQTHFKSGNDGGLQEVIQKCIVKFENEKRYKQDRRLIKLFIKYIDTRSNPQELYLQLYNNGIGTLVADLYIAWSYYFDVINDFQNADSIFQKGIDAGAQPYDELIQAHQAFNVSITKRILCKDDNIKKQFQETMDERRHALTRLNAHKNKYVGSIRTGIAVKHENPGKFIVDENQSSSNHQKIVVHQDLEVASNFDSMSLVGKSILETAKTNENIHEPGPWTKAKVKVKGKGVFTTALIGATSSNFNILEDDTIYEPILCPRKLYEKGICLPPGFISKNKPQKSWEVPIVIEESQIPNSIPKYDKFLTYPARGVEISLEEIRGYKWFKNQNKTSSLTVQYDFILTNKFENGCRIIPGFTNKNIEQSKINYPLTNEVTDGKIMCKINEMITESSEISTEELLARKFYRGEIKLVTADDFEEIENNDDMDITQIGDRRQSFYPLSRMSIIPRKSILRKSVFQPAIVENPEDDTTKNDYRHRVRFENPLQEMREEGENEKADDSNNSITKKRKLNEDVDQVNISEKNLNSEDKSDGEETLKAQIHHSSVLNTIKPEFINDKNENFPKIDSKLELFKLPPPIEKKIFKPFDLTEDDANDTCSTVQFNLFIKQQSVSTPISKKSVPKLVPLANQESSTSQANAFTIYTDDHKNEDVSDKNEIQEQGSENTGVCASIMQTNVLQPKLSTIMEVTETTQSTKSNVSSINDAESQALKSQLKNTPPESDKHFNNLSVFRIPEDQTETIPFNILKLAQIPKTPGRFLCLEESDVKQKQQLNDDKQQQSFMTIPKFEFSFTGGGDMSINNFSIMKPSLITQEKKELSYVEIPATQECTIENEKSHLTAPITQEILEKKQNLEIETATPQPISEKNTIENVEQNNVKELTISHVEISATQTELLHTELPNAQDSNKLVEEQQGFKFDIYEDTTACNAIPLVRIQPQNIKLDETNNFHASRKENYVDSMLKRNVSDEFLNLCSKSPALTKTINCPDKEVSDLLKFSDIKTNKTLENSFQTLAIEHAVKSASPTMNIFEEDLNTQKFSSLLTTDKNSTIIDSISQKQQISESKSAKKPLDISIEMDETETSRLNIEKSDAVFKVPQIPISKPTVVQNNQNKFEIFEDEEEEEDDDMSKTIYFDDDEKKREEIVDDEINSWEEEEMCSFILNSENRYEHTMIQSDVSKKLREAIIISNGNPFCKNVRNLILEHVNFEEYLAEHVQNCIMLKNIPQLKIGVSLECGKDNFKVMKFIAKGTFGSVYCIKNQKSGDLFAAKQEKPVNMYEYFICLELADRLRGKNIHMLKAFMQIHYAIIANNASVFITDLSPYGTLIDVCNKIKHVTGRNVDEYIGMIFTSQLLSIIDFLHSCHIIHADLKPDNLLLMSKVEIGMKVPALQLIDFGSAIDMENYSKDDTFNYVVETENFTCCEMKENRPWTYQTDLFGICGTAHVILFGKYMTVEKKLLNWEPTTKFPRYFQKSLWDIFFNTLLNVPDCNFMPNLQHLKQNFDVEIMERQKYVNEKIAVFNNALMS
ncbi:hypothetical protein PVAND_011517 [Polypedilum vanderplanki]|uniref:Mitotic checkpoint serine/threonine-protein kinase BUB1 n=1 Tax=Polypedilum vanderplanki TaxID=319348 RepID=A0A9J6CJQ1_POLVA|nr:hypothetical protein PVAND_011517 [Polypedilum vanderplanki]